MELIITGIFWLTILLLIHSYILYPLSLRILAYFKSLPNKTKPNLLPGVSVLISAYNEDKVIEERINNIKNLNYDFTKLQLIIGSDCSTDKTNEILAQKSNEYDWLQTQFFDKRRGKALVLNSLAEIATNEILVFTDANTRFDKEALLELVAKFSDERVGGVCGRLELEEPEENFDKTNRERLYWKYETLLKKLEGELGVLIAANGGIYAIRKKLFTKFPDSEPITDDLYQTFAVLNQGYNFLYAFNSIAFEDVSKNIITEFNRKVRFAATNFQTLKSFKRLLFNKNFLISYALWSHKVLRWFVPLILIILFITNIFLIETNQFYKITFILQAGFYSAALIGGFLNKIKINISFFSLFYYYALTNFALLVGLFKFLSNRHATVWQSTPR